MKSPLMKTLMDAAILLTAVCAINQGLQAFQYDLMAMLPAAVAGYAGYVFGAAGVYSLVMFFMGCCHEGSCGCK